MCFLYMLKPSADSLARHARGTPSHTPSPNILCTHTSTYVHSVCMCFSIHKKKKQHTPSSQCRVIDDESKQQTRGRSMYTHKMVQLRAPHQCHQCSREPDANGQCSSKYILDQRRIQQQLELLINRFSHCHCGDFSFLFFSGQAGRQARDFE